MYKPSKLLLISLVMLLVAPLALAEDKAQKPAGGPPPMLVATSEVITGMAEPVASFIGTVYFARTAQVAAEVSGKVGRVFRDDGQTVNRGDRLAWLDDALLQTDVAGTRATLEQNEIDLEQARRDFSRIATLHQQDAIATTEYEAYHTRVDRLEKLATILSSKLDRLLLEQAKKTIRVPFDGIIIQIPVVEGEWVDTGGTIATVADNRNLEVLADIPADMIEFLDPDKTVELTVADKPLRARFVTVIPKGDIATRTFNAKFKIEDATRLIEGMEARISLPIALPKEGLLVPRDAVIISFGQNVVFTINEGLANMIPVQIDGHSGMLTAVSGPGLKSGQQVIVKGNARIRNGQPVRTGQ